MTEANNELGRVSSLRADAVGQPGLRRFRLLAEFKNGGSAVLWMEKEQLFNLGVALKRIIATVEEETTRHGAGHTLVEESNPQAHIGQALEFEVGRLAVGYDERTASYIIVAHAVEDPEEIAATASLVATHQEMNVLADQAFEVCAAGRPRCLLCGAPVGPERHVCPRDNGHEMLEA